MSVSDGTLMLFTLVGVPLARPLLHCCLVIGHTCIWGLLYKHRGVRLCQVSINRVRGFFEYETMFFYSRLLPAHRGMRVIGFMDRDVLLSVWLKSD